MMNERILELAKQADLKFSSETAMSPVELKFAELIVRECINELETSRKCDPYTGNLFDCEYNICLNEQTIMLKEHFGVKK